MRWMWIWASVLLIVACGGKERPKLVPPEGTAATTGVGTSGATGTGGRSASGGKGGTDDPIGGETGESGAGGDGTSEPSGPVVQITSPLEVLAPDDGEILLQDEIDVFCEVRASEHIDAAPINPASIKIAMLEASGKVTERAGAATGVANQFAATFLVSTVPSGGVSFRCTASDRGAPVRTARHQISTFVDHGPVITVGLPVPDAAYPLLGALDFEFSVDAVPLADDDAGSAIAGASLEVHGVPIEITEDAKEPGRYTASVDFTDATLFEEVPTGSVPVSIRAFNSREPSAAEKVENYGFTLDADGPVIAISRPTNNEVIGDDLQMVFTVKDAGAGIQSESVTVRLNGTEYRYDPASPLWGYNNGTFTFNFDSTQIKNAVSQVTVNVNASDLVGNVANGESLFLYIDNEPPIVSLDTSNVRVATYSGTKATCSVSFDPLGTAANDGQVIDRFARLRAFVWDQTNGTDSQEVLYLAGVDPNEVYLYLQPDSSRPLLIDKDGDGYCDDVDDDGGKIPFQHLDPITPGGNLWYGADDSPALPPPWDDCAFRGEDQPSTLCLQDASDMSYVIRQFNSGQSKAPSAVYAPAVTSAQTYTCTGSQWDLPSVAHRQGWLCLAARALDDVKNIGISAPLRVCVDDETDTEEPDCSEESMPDCTDGCIPPPRPPMLQISYR